MAKEGKTGLTGLVAFAAMILNAVYWGIQMMNEKGWITVGGKLIDSMQVIATIALTVVVLIVAWDFARHQSKGWVILYIILAVITVLAILVGFGVNLAN